MYEYRLCLYVCDLDVTFFIAGCRASRASLSKSLRTAYWILVVASLDIVDRETLDLERGKELQRGWLWGWRWRSFIWGGERSETGLVQAACWRLWDAKDSCSCAPLCEGWGCVVEWREGGTATMRKALEWPTTSMRTSPTLFLTGTVNIDVGNSWLVAMQRADAAQVEWFSWLQRVRSHSYPVFSVRPQRRHPEEYEAPTTIASLYSVLLELFSQRRWLLPLPLTQPFTTYSLTTSSLPVTHHHN